MKERLEELAKRKEEALQPGSDRSVERQHGKGKLLAHGTETCAIFPIENLMR